MEHPRIAYGLDLAPNDVVDTAFIFDVPRDAKPKTLTVMEGPRITQAAAIAEVDLTTGNLGEIPPEETLALSWEYMNTGQFALTYDLYSAEAQAQVTLDQFTRGNDTPCATEDYAFPSVQINGQQAVVERVLTVYVPEDFTTTQDRKTQPMVRESGVWKIQLRPDQLEYLQQQ